MVLAASSFMRLSFAFSAAFFTSNLTRAMRLLEGVAVSAGFAAS